MNDYSMGTKKEPPETAALKEGSVFMGAYAADILCAGSSNRVVAYKHGEFVDYDIEEALAMQKEIPEYHYQVSKALAT